jgi:hypothetical protein
MHGKGITMQLYQLCNKAMLSLNQDTMIFLIKKIS